jgi:hypothetical protein
VRSKSPIIHALESTGGDYTATRKMESENAAFRDAVKEGLRPSAPTHAAVDAARRAADAAGQPTRTA